MFIYLYNESTLKLDEFKKVEDHAQKMANGLRVRPYRLNRDKMQDKFISYFVERNPKT